MAKILVVEDERDIRDLVSFTLQYAGHEVLSATNGAEGVEQAKAELPDLIIMDVRMPVMTGYEACRVLKAKTDESKRSRLALCELTARALGLGLSLLGIETLERM